MAIDGPLGQSLSAERGLGRTVSTNLFVERVEVKAIQAFAAEQHINDFLAAPRFDMPVTKSELNSIIVYHELAMHRARFAPRMETGVMHCFWRFLNEQNLL